MRYAQDIRHQKFGKLTALRPSGRSDSGTRLWLFRCECGGEVEKRPSAVKLSVERGYTPSCGSCGDFRGSDIVREYRRHREGFTDEQRRRYEAVLNGRRGVVVESESVEIVVRGLDRVIVR